MVVVVVVVPTLAVGNGNGCGSSGGCGSDTGHGSACQFSFALLGLAKFVSFSAGVCFADSAGANAADFAGAVAAENATRNESSFAELCHCQGAADALTFRPRPPR